MKGQRVAAVSCPHPRCRLTGEGDLLVAEARLVADHGAGAALALQAVAHRDARWFALNRKVKLPAAAAGASGGHRSAPWLWAEWASNDARATARRSRYPITGTFGCCALAASGHAADAPPSGLMKSRRCMCSPQPKDYTLPHRCGNAALCITTKLAADGR